MGGGRAAGAARALVVVSMVAALATAVPLRELAAAVALALIVGVLVAGGLWVVLP
jgi:hypothetical protein